MERAREEWADVAPGDADIAADRRDDVATNKSRISGGGLTEEEQCK
jgi:hypothetical protein